MRAACTADRADPVAAGSLENAELTEASGLVASPAHDGVLWAHNDSGDGARLFALSSAGDDLGVLELAGVSAVDFEDLAAAPCPDFSGPCLYAADTGDNALERDDLAVYAIPEPNVDAQTPLPAGSTAQALWRFPISATEPVDIEAFVVDPLLSQMVFFEKREDDQARILVYKAPWTAENNAVLEEAGTFKSPGVDVPGGHLVTGASLHTSGTRLLLRTYSGVFEALLDPAVGLTADKLEGSMLDPVFFGPVDEPQGEAVTYDAAGTGIFTVSETAGADTAAVLHHSDCG